RIISKKAMGRGAVQRSCRGILPVDPADERLAIERNDLSADRPLLPHAANDRLHQLPRVAHGRIGPRDPQRRAPVPKPDLHSANRTAIPRPKADIRPVAMYWPITWPHGRNERITPTAAVFP